MCGPLRVTSLLILVPFGVGAIDTSDFARERIIDRDVVILGGGASGSFAAVKLKEDFGKSVVVVEKQDHLGGHVATYTDPITNISYDYGVQSYIDYGPTRDFFSRFSIPVMNFTGIRSNKAAYYDFTTGHPVNYVSPNANAALAKYLEQASRYEELLLPGYWNFPKPDEIPEDLLLNFGDFTKKYGIEDAVPRMFEISGLRVDPMTTPTLYTMQAFGAPITRAVLPGGSTFIPASRNNSELYSKISRLLGDDVLYSSVVSKSQRTSRGVELVVKTGDGSSVLIRAKRLLVAFEPTLDNMEPLDLDEEEGTVFSKWEYTNAFTGIASHSSLPINGSVVNIPAAGAPSNYLVVPKLPALGRFNYIGDPGFRVIIGGNKKLDHAGAQDVVQKALDTLIDAGSLPRAAAGEKVKFVAFSDHNAMHLIVTAEDLRRGFIQAQYSLQGHRATWYTGAAWSAQYTSMVWAYTDTVLPRLIDGL